MRHNSTKLNSRPALRDSVADEFAEVESFKLDESRHMRIHTDINLC